MIRNTLLFALLLVLYNVACTNKKPEKSTKVSEMMFKENLNPPIADKIDTALTIHGDSREDPYYWMKLTDEQKNAKVHDEQTTKVHNYLQAENDYKSSVLLHTVKAQDNLFNEIIGRIKQTDMSVPYKENGYFYITRFEEGNEYPIYSRKKGKLDNSEEILLDVNQLAKDFDYYNIAGRTVSPDNSILAYGEDTLSRRIYTIKFKDLLSGNLLSDIIPNTTGAVVWANDNKTVFYTIKDKSLRSYKVYRHVLGTDSANDEEVYHEQDETFSCFVYKTKTNAYIVIGAYATLSREFRILDANDPAGVFKIFQNRERKLEYSITHDKSRWLIKTNLNANNFRLMSCPENQTEKQYWTEVIPNRPDILLEDVEVFEKYIVLSERIKGIRNLRVIGKSGEDYYIEFGEDAFVTYVDVNKDMDSEILRMSYSSMTTPNTTYDFNMKTKKRDLLKQQEVLGDFNSADYSSERLYAKASDGTEIPISIVYKKGFKKDGTHPCLLYGYGSYGASMDPYFSSVRLSLLDRGFVFAIAHIRGGEEMGRKWYEEGKLLNKKNTFTDFIACGEFLVDQKYVSKDALFAMGGSAGGLLMGAVINIAPDMWKGVIAAVPFVDVVTTMLDETIPLTTGEYDEWGNPNDKVYYDYIKSYSPYDNVESKAYPALLVTTGYHDSQVQYWEPAKWVAKLRDKKTDNNPLIMHCNMDAGHGGKSGRFRAYKETAMEYAFLLDLAGKLDNELKD